MVREKSRSSLQPLPPHACYCIRTKNTGSVGQSREQTVERGGILAAKYLFCTKN